MMTRTRFVRTATILLRLRVSQVAHVVKSGYRRLIENRWILATPSNTQRTHRVDGPPNGLPFSRRKRCTDCQNTNDLAREAVGCNGGLGASALYMRATKFGRFPRSDLGIISLRAVGTRNN